jgi:hypothetical protein
LLVLFAGLSVVGWALYGSHVRHGGLYSDDWAFASAVQYGGGLFDRYDALRDSIGFRPLGILSVVARFSLLGDHARWHLGVALGSTVLLCLAIYLLLRTLRMERIHAGAIAFLVLGCPYADATRLWATGSGANVVLALWLIGVVVALNGFDAATPRRRAVMHGIAVTLYVCSLLAYEAAYVGICAGGLLYLTRANWRRALKRSIVDIAAATVTVVLIATQSTVPQATSFSEKVRLMVGGALRIFTEVAVPFGRPSIALVLGVLALIAAGSVAVALLLSRAGGWERRVLTRWLLTAAAGVVVAFAGYVTYAVAMAYYHPLSPGLANRTNVIATPGFIITVYALLVIAGMLLARRLRPGSPAALAVPLIGAAVIFAGYQDRTRASADVWDRAYSQEMLVVNTVKRSFPELPASATVYTFGHPLVSENPGLPIFISNWELRGALQVTYDDPSISGYPALPGTSLACNADGAHFTGTGYGADHGDRYGELFVVDVPSGRAERVDSRRECRALAPTLAPGPLQVLTSPTT